MTTTIVDTGAELLVIWIGSPDDQPRDVVDLASEFHAVALLLPRQIPLVQGQRNASLGGPLSYFVRSITYESPLEIVLAAFGASGATAFAVKFLTVLRDWRHVRERELSRERTASAAADLFEELIAYMVQHLHTEDVSDELLRQMMTLLNMTLDHDPSVAADHATPILDAIMRLPSELAIGVAKG